MHTPKDLFHTAIVGAGASGLFCAGSFSASKIILEANSSPARKVAVSGGGKCNFTNTTIAAANYISQNKHFCKNALAAFKPADFTSLLDQNHIPWQERSHGRLFARQATDIVRFLIRRARAQSTELALDTRVLDIQKEKELFVLSTSAGPVRAKHVVLATGGLSFPALGTGAFGLQIARRLGLNVVEPRPALCGLMWPKEMREHFATLAGNSLPVVIRQGKHVFEDDLLFTHEGISGPAVLQLSLFWCKDSAVEINFLPGQEVTDILYQNKNSSKTFSSVMKDFLPGKIARVLLAPCDSPLANASREQILKASHLLHHFQFNAAGTFGYTKAEVTAGGVDTRELNPSTLECRRIPGLFVIGELADVTGNLGGFNLHWAWASAWAAAQALQQYI